MSLSIRNRDDIERVQVMLDVHQSTDSPGIVSFCHEHHGAELELDGIGHFARGNVDLDRVVGLDVGVWIADRATVVGDSNRNFSSADKHFGDAAQFERGFLAINSVQYESSLRVHHETESVAALFQFNYVHDTGRKVVVGSDLAVNLDTALHANLLALLARERVLEAFTKQDANGDALTRLVWARRWLGGPHPTHLGEVPVLWRIEALQVFFRSARPVRIIKKETAVLVTVCDP